VAATDVIKLILVHFPAEGVAVDSKRLGGAGLVASRFLQRAPDKLLLEFRDSFFEKNAALDHHANQRFQLLFHVCMLREAALWRGLIPGNYRAVARWRRSREDAERVSERQFQLVECVACDTLVCVPILLARRSHNVRGKRRSRRLLVPPDLLKIIADVLLIERRLRRPRRILI
jgi:hypothetical protein